MMGETGKRTASSVMEMVREDAILTIIAVEVGNARHGNFVTSVARAWFIADSQNKNIIRTTWSKTIERYQLRDMYRKAIEKHLPEYLEGS